MRALQLAVFPINMTEAEQLQQLEDKAATKDDGELPDIVALVLLCKRGRCNPTPPPSVAVPSSDFMVPARGLHRTLWFRAIAVPTKSFPSK
jgi:hypothetical protein